MSSSASVALVNDLESAIRSGSSQRRIAMLRQTTDLFLSDADRLNEQQIAVFDDVLVRLMDHMEKKALASLSNQFAELQSAPREVVRQLAFHEDADVAVPVLEKSTRLSDADLVSLASSRGLDHLLAISRRDHLAEDVTDALIQRDENQVSLVLAANPGARFSARGYSDMVERSERDDDLAERLGLRGDMPKDLLKKLLSMATERIRAKLLSIASPELRETIKDALDSITQQIGTIVRKPTDYTKAQDAVVALNRAGNLTDSALNRFAFEGDHKHMIAALSLLTSVPIEAIEPVFENSRPDGLIIACRAAKASWPTTVVLLNNRPRCPKLPEEQLNHCKTLFDTLTLASAQRTIRFWSACSAAKADAVPLD
ncbi:MAG: DUF2336 domain-containing protein [Xanthobacteraceae bacterium]|nr:DUF2336 domain-containing protein [Xanthobacteraceae bacterium]